MVNWKAIAGIGALLAVLIIFVHPATVGPAANVPGISGKAVLALSTFIGVAANCCWFRPQPMVLSSDASVGLHFTSFHSDRLALTCTQLC